MKNLLLKLNDALNKERKFEVATYEILSEILQKVEGIEQFKTFLGLMTQSGSYLQLIEAPLVVGRTYVASNPNFTEYRELSEMPLQKFIIGNEYRVDLRPGDDFTNIGQIGVGTDFIATGEIPNNWTNQSTIRSLSPDNFSNVGGEIAFVGMTFKAVDTTPINWQQQTTLFDFANPELTVFKDDFNNIKAERLNNGLYKFVSNLPVFKNGKTTLLFFNVPSGVSMAVNYISEYEIQFTSTNTSNNQLEDNLIENVYFELKVVKD